MQNKPYEGTKPYVFISYSHQDMMECMQLSDLFYSHGVRCWYDDGLHFGDDWNLSIATHLEDAAVCLLLLSPNSAASEYVKNELSFANSKRVPVYSLLIKPFSIPSDIELMTGRIQRIEMLPGFERELLKALPAEVFHSSAVPDGRSTGYVHPLYESHEVYLESQGTKTHRGRHSRLGYPCAVQEDQLKPGDERDARVLAACVSCISHPLFPRIYDIVIENGVCRTYQEYREEQFLDHYLRDHRLPDEQVLRWISQVVDGIAYLHEQNLGLRDFARGSLVVLGGRDIGIFRLQNLYYGLVKLTSETKQYYFEQALQEIAILLSQLCTGKIPLLPLRFIGGFHRSRQFLNTVNLVIQKCTRENGRAGYTSFEQLRRDLAADSLRFSDTIFLNIRRKKLERYEAAVEERRERLEAIDVQELTVIPPLPTTTLEEDFGFDCTVVLHDPITESTPFQSSTHDVTIRILSLITGQVFTFRKDSILIGRDQRSCDLVWTQRHFTHIHVRVTRLEKNTYTVTDMSTANGTCISRPDVPGDGKDRLQPDQPVTVPADTIIYVGDTGFRILPEE